MSVCLSDGGEEDGVVCHAATLSAYLATHVACEDSSCAGGCCKVTVWPINDIVTILSRGFN